MYTVALTPITLMHAGTIAAAAGRHTWLRRVMFSSFSTTEALSIVARSLSRLLSASLVRKK